MTDRLLSLGAWAFGLWIIVVAAESHDGGLAILLFLFGVVCCRAGFTQWKHADEIDRIGRGDLTPEEREEIRARKEEYDAKEARYAEAREANGLRYRKGMYCHIEKAGPLCLFMEGERELLVM